MLVWAPLASGAYRGWLMSVAFVLIALAAAAWLGEALAAGRLTWRRTPLDLPVALLLAVIAVQLALGNRALVAWALAPPRPVPELAAPFPTPFLSIGSVTPRQTFASAAVFVGYAAVYFLVAQVVRTRRQLGRLVRTLLAIGGLMAFLGLLDYLTGETWLLVWRDHPYGGRLSGTFVNPDHFAAWLAMLVLLGLGWVASRAPEQRRRPPLRALLSVRELREQVARRYLPLIAVVTMGVALIFTLSRGGLVGLVVGLLAFLVLLRAVGRARRSLLVTGVLLVGVLAYGGWIGFGPLLERLAVTSGASVDRAAQYLASLPMLRDFPLLGVGLGAYRDIYFRYQPAAHQPDRVYYPYAHNDLLQLLLELGVIGGLVGLFLAWRVVRDLVGAHLLGRAACPVDGGEGPEALRNDRYSLGVATGALAGLAALVAHSALDFSARIPAVGFLGATLLGLATVALHTRLQPGSEQLLSGVRTLALDRPRRRSLVVGLAVVVLVAWSAGWVHGARERTAEDALTAAPPGERLARASALLALDGGNLAGRFARARARHEAALAAWTSPAAAGVDRAGVARELLADARADLRAALTVSPTNPFIHRELAWVEAADAVIEGRTGPAGLAAAFSHGARAVTLAADSAPFYAALARIGYAVPDFGLGAAREAARRQPELLGALVDVYRPLGLTEAEWLVMVPERSVDRLDLAMTLEARGLGPAALAAYRAAANAAPPAEAPVYLWALGEALARAGRADEAVDVLRAARPAGGANPELERALGAALAQRGDPEALDHLRLAVNAMERRAGDADPHPFPVRDRRLAALVARLGADVERITRYRRTLARYLTERRLWDQALEEWQALTRAEPRDPEARFNLGLAREATGAADAALEDYRAAVGLAPNEVRYRKRLAEQLWRSEQYFQAVNEWRTVTTHAPRDVPSRLALARAYERLGQRVDAYRQYRAVLDVEPGQPDATRALARLEGRAR